MLRRWVRIVSTLTDRASAISALERPAWRCSRTSASRGVRSSGPSGSGVKVAVVSDTGKVLYQLEHEVRSMRHPQYDKPLLNRNPDQSSNYNGRGYDLFRGIY